MSIDRREIEATFTHFVVRAFGYWGKGKTLKEAKDNCVKEGAKRREKFDAFWGTENIEVLDNGTVQATNLVYLGEI